MIGCGVKDEGRRQTWLPSFCQKTAGGGLPLLWHWKVTLWPGVTAWSWGPVTSWGGTAAVWGERRACLGAAAAPKGAPQGPLTVHSEGARCLRPAHAVISHAGVGALILHLQPADPQGVVWQHLPPGGNPMRRWHQQHAGAPEGHKVPWGRHVVRMQDVMGTVEIWDAGKWEMQWGWEMW